MTFDLETIQEMWEKDAKIDRDNLHDESLNIPSLHAKYFQIYNTIFLLRKKAEQQRKNIRQNRTYQIKNAIEFMRFNAGMG